MPAIPCARRGGGGASRTAQDKETAVTDDAAATSPTAIGARIRPAVAMDVARASGVSQKTVSRVINGDPHVSTEVRERVNRTIAELGYRPNRAARALVLGRSRTIGVLSVG